MYRAIARNKRLSVAYVVLFFVFWSAVGALVGLIVAGLSAAGVGYRSGYGRYAPAASVVAIDPASAAASGAVVALVAALIAAGVVLTFGTDAVLQTAGARPADPRREAALVNLVAAMALGEGIPTPAVFVIDDPSPNAFATGTSPAKAAITVTTGLLAMMNREELEGVLAHELSHIRNFDVRLILVVTGLIGLAGVLASVGFRSLFWARLGRGRDSNQLMIVVLVAALFLSVFAVVLGPLVKLALSRRRESLADASGVELTRNPAGLLSALRKLQQVEQPFARFNSATAAMCIVDPTQRAPQRSWLAKLYDTHPPIEERIAALETLMMGRRLADPN